MAVPLGCYIKILSKSVSPVHGGRKDREKEEQLVTSELENSRNNFFSQLTYYLEVEDLWAFVELGGRACAYNAQHRGLSHRYPQAYSQDEKKRN